jgi:hypothetical protein
MCVRGTSASSCGHISGKEVTRRLEQPRRMDAAPSGYSTDRLEPKTTARKAQRSSLCTFERAGRDAVAGAPSGALFSAERLVLRMGVMAGG